MVPSLIEFVLKETVNRKTFTQKQGGGSLWKKRRKDPAMDHGGVKDEKPIKKTRGRMQHGQFGKTLAYLRNGKVSIAGTLEKTPEK